jgi:hypothetical protein
VGDVEAEWEASGVLRDEGYVWIDGLGITGASFDNRTREMSRPSGKPLGY